MLNIKKAISVIAASAIAAALFAGCGNSASGNASETTANGAETAAEPTVSDTGWTYGQVSIGGGGFVTGIISTCEKGVFYARTDVGGAYRWDDAEKKWKSMSYAVSEEDVGLLGIDGIAADPCDASKVYLLAGTEYFSGGKTCLMKSTDYGKTFTQIDLTDVIRVHGNGMGRGNGERIAVDPNCGDVIFAGGRTGGMIKSTDGGLNWTKVESFPVSSTKNANGINGIIFDKSSASGGVTQRIYASVSQKDTDDGNLFVSEDAGATWSKLANAENGYMPQRMKLDSKGSLYVTYANNEGPWNAVNGTVVKYSGGNAETIAPSKQSFGDIVINPTDENKMLLVTTEMWTEQPNGAFGDIFYVTTDGGKNWTNILGSMTMTDNGMSWIDDCAIHWCSSLAIDPDNPNRILVNSGNGIFACDNIWDAAPAFYFDASGLEETVPLDIISIKDMPLVSAAGDYDGFIHTDIFTPAVRHSDKIGTTSSITIAAKNTSVWAKVGGSDKGMLLDYSTDGGKSWNKITNSPEAGKTLYQGRVALTADGSTLIWLPSNQLFAYCTSDWGKTWTKCDGLAGKDLYIIGDPENASYVYACGSDTLYASSDGGKSFARIPSTVSGVSRICVIPGEEGSFYVAAGAGLYKYTSHGESSELVTGPVSCKAVSIGKAKADGAPYVIYIYGTTRDNEAKGIYMSEDNGVSWTRITDDLHQFGGMGNGNFICGDMNVYGRCYMSTVGLGIAYCDKSSGDAPAGNVTLK